MNQKIEALKKRKEELEKEIQLEIDAFYKDTYGLEIGNVVKVVGINVHKKKEHTGIINSFSSEAIKVTLLNKEGNPGNFNIYPQANMITKLANNL